MTINVEKHLANILQKTIPTSQQLEERFFFPMYKKEYAAVLNLTQLLLTISPLPLVLIHSLSGTLPVETVQSYTEVTRGVQLMFLHILAAYNSPERVAQYVTEKQDTSLLSYTHTLYDAARDRVITTAVKDSTKLLNPGKNK